MTKFSFNFRRRAGTVTVAQPLWAEITFGRRSLRGLSSAQKLGLKYEEKTLDYLYSRVPTFISHLPFKFYSSTDAGRAIPDGIIFELSLSTKTITLVEIKYRHTLEAWYQLSEFYLPIVERAYPSCKIKLLEICKNYDPGVKLPGSFTLLRDLSELENSNTRYNVLIYSDKFKV